MIDYRFPESIEEALSLMEGHRDSARIVAGGTDLMLLIEKEANTPRLLIDITRVPSLRTIEVEGDYIKIGAAATYRDLLAYAAISERVQFLADAIRTIGGVQIRNVATLIGNITNASPAGDALPPLYILGTEVVISGLRETRSLPIEDFILGVRRTALQPGELVTHIKFELPGNHWYGHFDKIGLRRAMAIAVVSAAFLIHIDNGKVDKARIALGAVAPTVVRASDAEAYLIGRELDEETIGAAAEIAVHSISPIDDLRATAEYRILATRGVIRRALRLIRDQVGA